MSTLHSTPQVSADEPIARADAVRLLASFLLFALLWGAGLFVVAPVLLPQRLRDVLGAEAATGVFGVINACTAFVSLLSNLIVGNLSDRTRSRLGRRTPWIVSGGVIAGVSLALIGFLEDMWLIGVSYCVCMVGLNMMIAPVVATLSDRVPANMRGTMSAFMAGGTAVGSALGQMLGSRFLSNQVPGFLLGGVLMGLAGICTVLVWPKEPSAKNLPWVSGGFAELLKSFIPPIKGARDFWMAFMGRSLFIFAYYMVLNYQLYILEDYIGQTASQAGDTIAVMSVITMVVGLVSSFAGGPISDRIGRRKILIVFASVFLLLGFLLPWVLRTPLSMMLFAGFAGFGYGLYGAVDQALNVDVLPNKEEAGKDLGILNIATTLGQMVGPIVTSAIVAATGTYNAVFPVGIAFAVFASVFIMAIRRVK